MSPKTLCLCALLSVASACAAKAPVSGASDEAPAATPRNRDLITEADLAADPTLRARTVLEVIQALRPHFLNERGSTLPYVDQEAGKVHASIDGTSIVPVSELSGVNANTVVQIRYLSAAQAMQKFGVAARQGPVILVMTTLK